MQDRVPTHTSLSNPPTLAQLDEIVRRVIARNKEALTALASR